jgi:phospholipid-binding lipoprotein MlaA
VAFAFCLLSGAAARADDVYDPIEPVNRAVFAFNNTFDNYILEPVAKGYRKALPQHVRRGVFNFVDNLRTPLYIANQALQGDLKGVGSDTARGVLNTTIGVAGFRDVATAQGYPRQAEDFGQTLGKWGVGSGAYLVLPVVGPSNIRDTSGMLVDGYADPLRIYFNNKDLNALTGARVAVTVVAVREQLLDVLADLERNSLDYYTVTKSGYSQRRAALIADENPNSAPKTVIPTYDDE